MLDDLSVFDDRVADAAAKIASLIFVVAVLTRFDDALFSDIFSGNLALKCIVGFVPPKNGELGESPMVGNCSKITCDYEQYMINYIHYG